MDLTTATQRWREKKAEMERAYELFIDKSMELREVTSPYARAQAKLGYQAAKMTYETAKNAATEARVTMTDLASAIAANG